MVGSKQRELVWCWDGHGWAWDRVSSDLEGSSKGRLEWLGYLAGRGVCRVHWCWSSRVMSDSYLLSGHSYCRVSGSSGFWSVISQ